MESDANTCGTKFAEQQLLRHGWKQGKGLGRNESGISEAIRVKVKCDKGGIGHKESEQFTFHWWDHVFNKASAGLLVESAQNGVTVKKVDKEEEGGISNKKPRKALLDKSALYGNFVKSATLLSGQEKPERPSSCSDDDSSDEDEKLDLSSTRKLSDAELMKVCGGRTAHKGARHGLTMSAKLARLEQQELEFMEKYGQKNQRDKTTSPGEELGKKKEKKKKLSEEAQENGVQNPGIHPEAERDHSAERTSRKKKRSLKDEEESGACGDALDDVGEAGPSVHKKKKKRKHLDQDEEEHECNPKPEPGSENVSKKHNKKAKKRPKEARHAEERPQTNDCDSDWQEPREEGGAGLHRTPEVVSKRRKKKSSKHEEEPSGVEASDWKTEEETSETASKKRKTSREEQEEEERPSSERVKKKKNKKKKLEKWPRN